MVSGHPWSLCVVVSVCCDQSSLNKVIGGGAGILGQNFSFNIFDRGHDQDSATFYGIAKARRVVEIRRFSCRKNSHFL